MPFAIVLIVGIVFINSGVINKVKKTNQETVVEIVTKKK